MRRPIIKSTLALALLLYASCPNLCHARVEATNVSPSVSIAWPRWDDLFSLDTLIKIKANATDRDARISQVEFFAETNLIGVATNAPFAIIWPVGDGILRQSEGHWMLKAVAVNELGTRTESAR